MLSLAETEAVLLNRAAALLASMATAPVSERKSLFDAAQRLLAQADAISRRLDRLELVDTARDLVVSVDLADLVTHV